jgi:hypothetical protein
MTLPELLTYASTHTTSVIFYFALIPFAALLAGWMDRNESHLPPWNYLYSCMLYLVATPAVFAVGLALWRWSHGAPLPLDLDAMIYLLPPISFVATTVLIQRQVPLGSLPGFGAFVNLVGMIAVTLLLLWLLDYTGSVDLLAVRFSYLLLFFLLLLYTIRVLWRRMTT